jgi:hypothetical protein
MLQELHIEALGVIERLDLVLGAGSPPSHRRDGRRQDRCWWRRQPARRAAPTPRCAPGPAEAAASRGASWWTTREYVVATSSPQTGDAGLSQRATGDGGQPGRPRPRCRHPRPPLPPGFARRARPARCARSLLPHRSRPAARRAGAAHRDRCCARGARRRQPFAGARARPAALPGRRVGCRGDHRPGRGRTPRPRTRRAGRCRRGPRRRHGLSMRSPRTGAPRTCSARR